MFAAGVFAAAFGKEPTPRDGVNVGSLTLLLDAGSPVNARDATSVKAPLLPDVVDGVNHNIRKNRFISFNPNNPATPVALMVEMLDLGCSATRGFCVEDSDCKTCIGGPDTGDACHIDADCDGGGVCSLSGETCDELAPARRLGWVSEPFEPGGDAPPNTFGATIVPMAPAFRAWPEWVVHIGDCPIAPVRAYGIRATADLVNFSDHLRVGTISKPKRWQWADIAGPFDGSEWTAPDSLNNAHDYMAILESLNRDASSPHVTVTDLVGGSPTFVDWNVNATDFRFPWRWNLSGPFPPNIFTSSGYPDLNGGESLCDCPNTACPPIECGNGILEFGERCDDGNVQSGDGCDGGCRVEAVCGDGVVAGIEECDDANTDAGDGCDSDCIIEPGCGNGFVSGDETCDDGDTVSGDGCDEFCRIETQCGNGAVEFGEQCDDGNTESGDGCGPTCRREGPVVLEWVPVSSTVPATIVGNDITLPSPGAARVEFEAFLSGWGQSPGSPVLRAYNFAIEPRSMLGVHASPPRPGIHLSAPQGVACSNDADCQTGFCGRYTFGSCDDSEPAFVRRQVCSDDPALPCFKHDQCPGTSVCIDDPKVLLESCVGDHRVIPIQQLEWFGGCSSGQVADEGSRRYVGSLRIDVPVDAVGTYVIDFDHRPEMTFLLDEDKQLISGLSLVPSRLTIAAPIELPGTVDGVDHNIRKTRFLSINPRNELCATRLRVDLLDLTCTVTDLKCESDADCKICDSGNDAGDGCAINSDCPGGSCVLSGETCAERSPPVLLGYVSEPVEAGGDAPPGTLTSFVADDPPPLRLWPETLVHISDCEIAPVQTYAISVEGCGGVDAATPALIISTPPKPQGKAWGNIVGAFDGVTWPGPDRFVNVDDVVAILGFITLRRSAPHITVVELSGAAPTYTNFIVGATELFLILKAFSGVPYPPVRFLAEGHPDLLVGASLADCTGN